MIMAEAICIEFDQRSPHMTWNCLGILAAIRVEWWGLLPDGACDDLSEE
jgi:hypothetical protein